jgi:hypothetical protein
MNKNIKKNYAQRSTGPVDLWFPRDVVWQHPKWRHAWHTKRRHQQRTHDNMIQGQRPPAPMTKAKNIRATMSTLSKNWRGKRHLSKNWRACSTVVRSTCFWGENTCPWTGPSILKVVMLGSSLCISSTQDYFRPQLVVHEILCVGIVSLYVGIGESKGCRWTGQGTLRYAHVAFEVTTVAPTVWSKRLARVLWHWYRWGCVRQEPKLPYYGQFKGGKPTHVARIRGGGIDDISAHLFLVSKARSVEGLLDTLIVPTKGGGVGLSYLPTRAVPLICNRDAVLLELLKLSSCMSKKEIVPSNGVLLGNGNAKISVFYLHVC